MNVRILDKKERVIYFIWYMATTVILTALLTLIVVKNRGYIGDDLSWLMILLGILSGAGLVITAIKGLDIQMLRRAVKYKEYIAWWRLSPEEWKEYAGETIPTDQKRTVVFMRRGVTIGFKLFSWNRIGMKLENVEEIEKNRKNFIRLVYSSKAKDSKTGEKIRQNHDVIVPVPKGENAEPVIMRLKKENRLD